MSKFTFRGGTEVQEILEGEESKSDFIREALKNYHWAQGFAEKVFAYAVKYQDDELALDSIEMIGEIDDNRGETYLDIFEKLDGIDYW